MNKPKTSTENFDKGDTICGNEKPITSLERVFTKLNTYCRCGCGDYQVKCSICGFICGEKHKFNHICILQEAVKNNKFISKEQYLKALADQKAKMIEIIKNKIDNRLFDGISRLFANTRCDNIETIARKTRILTNSFKLDVEQLKEFEELR